MSFHKEYYLINLLLLMAKFSIHKCKYGDYKPLFFILKSEVKQYLQSIYTLIHKKAVKLINKCKHFHVLSYYFIVILYLFFLCVCVCVFTLCYCNMLNLRDSIKNNYTQRHFQAESVIF